MCRGECLTLTAQHWCIYLSLSLHLKNTTLVHNSQMTLLYLSLVCFLKLQFFSLVQCGDSLPGCRGGIDRTSSTVYVQGFGLSHPF